MRSFLFAFCFLISLALGGFAQDSVYVVKMDGAVFGFKISEVQEINFEGNKNEIPNVNPSDRMPSNAIQLAAKMNLGINIGNTMECPCGDNAETCWGSPVITQQIVDTYKKAGFNAIRIPVAWDNHRESESTFNIKASWMNRVKEVVDYAIKDDLYVIINIHWDNGWLEKHCTEDDKEAVNKEQAALWKQIATYFKDYDEHLLFASANEPAVDNESQAAVLKSYHQTFVNTVRESGGNNDLRCLVIQGANTAADAKYDVMPTDKIDGRLMFEFHYYPYTYCLMEQDADWGNMHYFWGKNYQNIYINGVNRSCSWHTEATVDSEFSNLKSKFVDKGIPVIMGEFAAMNRDLGSNQQKFEECRAYFYEYLVKVGKNSGIVPFLWDTPGTGIIDRDNCKVQNQTALDGLLKGANEGHYPF